MMSPNVLNFKILNNNNIIDFLSTAVFSTSGIFFLQLYDKYNHYYFLFFAFLSVCIAYFYIIKLLHSNYDIVLIVLFLKIFPIILLLILSYIFLHRKINVKDTILGIVLIFCGAYLIEK